MNKAPNIISTKDLDYIKDAFGWNYVCYKNVVNYKKNSKDKDLLKLLKKAEDFFDKQMTSLLTILEREINNG